MKWFRLKWICEYILYHISCTKNLTPRNWSYEFVEFDLQVGHPLNCFRKIYSGENIWENGSWGIRYGKKIFRKKSIRGKPTWENIFETLTRVPMLRLHSTVLPDLILREHLYFLSLHRSKWDHFYWDIFWFQVKIWSFSRK